ncbi:Crp/Fnr family transcriptional regulator [Chryseobacterium sp. 18068]|jgi:CRP-like cAMP-binding protein|uniref:Crp/Fnr family transcriptional regulator n=2 Tax=Chryseobacterium piscium TaxID=333702 RepID=A0A3D9BBC1_9FLAO|nr:Crp/Fnr family transcriptional regulator [Chryseobacterium sp. 18068]REC50677.1 Crp/Fnr family transcriptional regulator [Chryseobacterium piscium]
MEKLLNIYKSIEGLSHEEALYHVNKFEKIVFAKKTMILKEGTVEDYLYFIDKGIIRFFVNKVHPTEPSKEITFSFIAENTFCSAYDSFITRNPCAYNVETVQETVVYRIHFDDLQELYERSKVGNYLGRISAENLYVRKTQREISLLMHSAEERYLNLAKAYPNFIREIPLKHIASYIGITPQALSRIRKQNL